MSLTEILALLQTYGPWALAVATAWAAARERRGLRSPIVSAIIDLVGGILNPAPPRPEAQAPAPPEPLTVPSLRQLIREELRALKTEPLKTEN